jgi:hypothetical protein
MGFGFALSSHDARAATECNGTVTGAVYGGLSVHPGDACVVQSATVYGGIRMDGGTLVVCDSTINGAIDIRVTGDDSAASGVDIGNAEAGCAGNTVNGAVKISGVTGTAPLLDEEPSSIEIDGCFCENGDVGNFFNGSLTLQDNGFIEVEATLVNGSCKATGNAVVENSGFPNQIRGAVKDQCQGL